jgi:hypothetical protein
MYVPGHYYAKLDAPEATKANAFIRRRHGHELPWGALLPCVQKVSVLIVAGMTPSAAVTQVIQSEFTTRQKAGIRRKEQYAEALREAIWVRYDAINARLRADPDREPPPPPFKDRIVLNQRVQQKQRELSFG